MPFWLQAELLLTRLLERAHQQQLRRRQQQLRGGRQEAVAALAELLNEALVR
eukprot:COSAG01_NODE_2658_length_7302_cov_4.298626_1_plen_52_part_00